MSNETSAGRLAGDAESLALDMEAWLSEPFVSLTPMREMDVQAFIARIRALATHPGVSREWQRIGDCKPEIGQTVIALLAGSPILLPGFDEGGGFTVGAIRIVPSDDLLWIAAPAAPADGDSHD